MVNANNFNDYNNNNNNYNNNNDYNNNNNNGGLNVKTKKKVEKEKEDEINSIEGNSDDHAEEESPRNKLPTDTVTPKFDPMNMMSSEDINLSEAPLAVYDPEATIQNLLEDKNQKLVPYDEGVQVVSRKRIKWGKPGKSISSMCAAIRILKMINKLESSEKQEKALADLVTCEWFDCVVKNPLVGCFCDAITRDVQWNPIDYVYKHLNSIKPKKIEKMVKTGEWVKFKNMCVKEFPENGMQIAKLFDKYYFKIKEEPLQSFEYDEINQLFCEDVDVEIDGYELRVPVSKKGEEPLDMCEFAVFSKGNTPDYEWKAHISVKPNDLAKAWNAVFPILKKRGVVHFKVTRLNAMTNKIKMIKEEAPEADKEVYLKQGKRVTDGMQITIYITKGKEKEYNDILREINDKLKEVGARPGIIDEKTDRRISKRASVRLEKTTSDKAEKYKDSDDEDPFISLSASDGDSHMISLGKKKEKSAKKEK